MKEIKKNLVSIISPSYNTARFIREMIESVLMQTYSKWELIIIDDASSDNTDDIVNSFSDNRIIYLKNDKNKGAAYSRNRALRLAKGEWIAFLDSDDLWEKDKLSKQLTYMLDNGYKFSCTKHHSIDELSQNTGMIYTSPSHVSKIGMYMYCWPGCLTVMYHRPTIGEIQIEDLKKNNDYAIWLKAIRKADCYYLDEDLAGYRIRESSISHDKFTKLVKSHYLLFRVGERRNILESCILTILNMCFGVVKKIFFDKGNRNEI